MYRLSSKEIEILRFIRRSRHRTTPAEIARALGSTAGEIQVFVQGLVEKQLLNVARSDGSSEDAYYTNPEKREEIFDLIG